MGNADIPVIGPMLNKIFGSRNDRFVKRYTQRVQEIGALEAEMRPLTDQQLRDKVGELRERHDNGAKEDELLVPMFALSREAMDRHVGIRNIFNPEAGFDPAALPAGARKLYDEVKAEMDGLEPRAPEGDLLGNLEPMPSWVWVDIPAALYEAVRELYPESRPPFRARPFDVQLIGGMVLAQGKIAEMKTGEGKTIVAPLAAALAVMQRQQVHVVTVNDYLVQRDRDWTFRFFHGLGFTAGAIHPQHIQGEDIKRQMYRCDVVYGTTSEFGFDYLRDNMKRSVDQQVQRKRQFAIVDEVDSVLIDEARTPLIISGPAHEETPRYDMADKLARHLVDKQKPWTDAEGRVTACKERIKGLEGDIRQTRDKGEVTGLQKQLEAAKAELPELERARDEHVQYFELKPERKQSYLTHEGTAEAQKLAGVGSFYVDDNQDIPHLLEQAVRAYAVYERDKDYIVAPSLDRATGREELGVVIVDQNTGRAMPGRQWSDGLHQAVEVKEGVQVKQETQTVATVTVQNFFKMYKRLAGMTGTADTEAQEFHDIYKLDVVSIPTNKPMIRRDRDDLVFLRQKDKWDAIVEEIKAFHDAGRPVLVGTTSVEKSEMLSALLTRKYQIKHQVLNAKEHERESESVADAGQLGAVMVATNMAGRGTDIKLGQISRESLLDHWLRRGLCSRKAKVDMTDDEIRADAFAKIAPAVLGIKKREAEEMDAAELELELLRKWAGEHTLVEYKHIASMGRDELMDALDESGRFLLHRLGWFDSIEAMGGLHVLGTERHESRRIDNQLRGRAGRQGDNGSSRFYVSFEDDLMKLFAGEKTQALLARLGMKEGEAIEHPWVSKNVERAQKKVEERNFQIRKQILEYDEIMEHQRQSFYGLRQRVLEGRDVKGLIFGYIGDAIDDAIEEMLDPEYPALCAAEFAKEKLGYSILPERLRGKDQHEMDESIRKMAKDEAAAMIDVTLGEYMPVEGSEVSVDFDSAGLVGWAKTRFGVELDAGELREGGIEERVQVKAMLEEAAFVKVDAEDLSGLNAFVEKHYGAKRLSEWVERKFAFTVSADEIVKAHADEDRSARDPIIEKADELYAKREVEYPVEFMMDMTMALARRDPARAMDELSRWAKSRFGMELTADDIKKTNPNQIRERFVEESRKFVEEDKLDKAIAEATAIDNDDALDEHLKSRYNAGLTDRMRWLEDEERENAVRSRVENILRTELLFFERAVLLDTLDQTWKDHLYAMDQLRDAIGFRAFSQQDPRIQYKREGSQLFQTMQENVRDKVTDYIFRAKISPAAAMGLGGGG
ncbi:MAG: preprotein translocase subunit SecA, partial [Planctomycetota bacterium]